MAALPLLQGVALLGCVLLALVVGLRRERSPVASAVLGLLVALAVWNGGLGWAELAEPGPWRTAALRGAMLGMFAAVGFWLLAALRHRWPRRASGVAAVLVALAPVVVFFLGAVTNAGHGAFLLPDVAWDPGLVTWAGPATWRLASVSLLYGLVASAIFAFTGVRMIRRGERRPGIAVTLTLLAMPIVSLEAGVQPDRVVPVAAASLTLNILVLALTGLRYQLLEPPPLGHREVIDHLRDGVLMANAAGEILDHNPAAERLLGFTPRGRSIAEVLLRVAAPGGVESARRILARVREVGRVVSLQLDASGDRTFEVSARPIEGEDEELLGQIATLRDRTEERRLADAALRTQRLETLGTMAAGIAHEVNNPLAFVRANLGEIERMGTFVEERLEKGETRLVQQLASLGPLARRVQGGLERIQRAVSDVRRLAAAPQAGDALVSVDEVVNDAAELARRRIGDAPRIETRLAPDLPLVFGSGQLLVQAVLSLLLDAQQALAETPEPRIEIETGADEEGVFVHVRDNGPGLPEPLRGRTFEASFSGPPDASRVGLGLRVAAGIAYDHGGWLQTGAEASGGSYRLRLAAAGS